ncbi:Dynein regulatory complex protein 10 [Holothuria leucospilota]|uniref:Dynein regulatory complex protein 10 n=1 Tax=Holothuria leucospilota TaxID=206669 RepID=A0A9Q1CFP9_HOLLE|nr:Dynein regulatory complex protein 10 [Holothuria leucospilota]
MSFADMAVMETFRLLDKVRSEGPKERAERPNPQPPQRYKPVHKPRPPKQPQIKTDPLSILDPGRKKLTTVESQRVLAVLDESIKKIEVVSLLQYAVQNIDKYRNVMGDEMLTALQEHGNLQNNLRDTFLKLKEYREAKQKAAEEEARRREEEEENTGSEEGSPRESIKSQEGEDEPDEKEEYLVKTIKVQEYQVTFSCKNILRMLALTPSLVNSLRSEVKERDENASQMISHLKDLRGFILERLLTTPLEEKDKTEYLLEINVREKKNSEVIKKLSSELEAEIAEKDAEISKRNDEIRRLKGDRHQLEKFSEEHIRRTRLEADKSQQADLKNSEGKQATLQAEVQKLRNKLATMTAEHRDSELTLRKRKYKIETEVENWIQKYDQDMGERQEEYEDLDTIYTEEKAQLNELEERFKTLEAEYTTIVEERRIAQEKREQEQRELAAMIKAATIVQAFWRSYKCRKMLKAKNKKKGKKGKKGKKK